MNKDMNKGEKSMEKKSMKKKSIKKMSNKERGIAILATFIIMSICEFALGAVLMYSYLGESHLSNIYSNVFGCALTVPIPFICAFMSKVYWENK